MFFCIIQNIFVSKRGGRIGLKFFTRPVSKRIGVTVYHTYIDFKNCNNRIFPYRLWKAYKKIHKFMGVISFFSSQEWNFNNEANQRLYKKLNEVDRKKFDFNVVNLDWYDFFYYYIQGIRLFVFKDPNETIEASRIFYNR